MTHDQSNDVIPKLGHEASDITLPKNASDEGERTGASACNTSVRGATPEHDVYTPTSRCTAIPGRGTHAQPPPAPKHGNRNSTFAPDT
jgi:hypothetical protein